MSAHATCAKCDQPMRFNVPRLGDAGGYVHEASGSLECRSIVPSWFSSPDRIAALEAATAAWVGTPFMENSATPGTGVCCHFLTVALYRSTGCPCLPANFVAPRGSVRGMRGVTAARRIIDFVDKDLAGRFAKIESDPVPGDLIALLNEPAGAFLKHLGVVLPGNQFVHVLMKIGVRISPLSDPTYAGRLAEIRRPL